MNPRPADQFPPWPQAKVDPASYTTVPGKPEGKPTDIPAARALIEQAMEHLSRDGLGEPREPSTNEREALEILGRALGFLP